MIEYVKGDILESDADFVVCPVNCVGTMGAGLAKQMKVAWPSLDDEYQQRLRSGELNVMQPYTVSYVPERHPGGVVLFPTKFHYKDRSEIGNISVNLHRITIYRPFSKTGTKKNVTMAFPKLGCGLGGLKWFQVKPHIESFARFNDYQLDVIVYE